MPGTLPAAEVEASCLSHPVEGNLVPRVPQSPGHWAPMWWQSFQATVTKPPGGLSLSALHDFRDGPGTRAPGTVFAGPTGRTSISVENRDAVEEAFASLW